MAKFLFQPDPINGVQFRPVRIDIHLRVVKISNDEIYHDFQTNKSESLIVGTERDEVLQRIQRGFGYQFEMYGKLRLGCQSCHRLPNPAGMEKNSEVDYRKG